MGGGSCISVPATVQLRPAGQATHAAAAAQECCPLSSGLKPVTQATSPARTAGARLPSPPTPGVPGWPQCFCCRQEFDSVWRGTAAVAGGLERWSAAGHLMGRCQETGPEIRCLGTAEPHCVVHGAFRKVGCQSGLGDPVQAKVAWSGVCGQTYAACRGACRVVVHGTPWALVRSATATFPKPKGKVCLAV